MMQTEIIEASNPLELKRKICEFQKLHHEDNIKPADVKTYTKLVYAQDGKLEKRTGFMAIITYYEPRKSFD